MDLTTAAEIDPWTGWEATLFWALLASALLLLGYRIYRLSRGGPMADDIDGRILGALLVTVAVFHGQGAAWARWPALIYALLFGIIVMPVWVLGVYLPSRPGSLDHAVIGGYLLSLIVIAAAALAL